MSQDLQTWFRNYQETLRQEGYQQGQRMLFQHVLSLRFGTIPARFQQLLDACSVDDIHRWVTRLFTARSLPEIFE